MRIVALILCMALSVTAQAVVKLTSDGEDCRYILDTLVKEYTKAKTDYDKAVRAPKYSWRFVDPAQYPFWCSQYVPEPDKKYQAVVVDDKGTLIRKSVAMDGEHFQAVIMNWIPGNIRHYAMWFFYRDRNSKWKMEKQPMVTSVRIAGNDNKYYLCQ